MCDNLSVGLNSSNTFFVQSQVPELAELSMYFSFLVSLSRLKRNPTIKDEAKAYGVVNISYGFLGYPISQAADILAFKADLIPVGQDQLPHIDQTREIARSFNKIFKKPVFDVPSPLVGDVPVLAGTNGANKMSKSLDNYVAIAHSEKETKRRILGMVTDTKRQYLKDPGHPDNCCVFSYWSAFVPRKAVELRLECEKAKIGCADCKTKLASEINVFFAEIRDRRNYYVAHPDIVWDILSDGVKKARNVAGGTLLEVRDAMKISFPKVQ